MSFIEKYFSHCAQVFPLKGKVSCDANPLLFLIKVLAKPILRLNHLDRPPALSRKSRFQIYISWNPYFVVVTWVCAALLWVAINCFPPKLEILLWMDNSRICKTTFSSLSLLIDECCPDDAQAGWRTAGVPKMKYNRLISTKSCRRSPKPPKSDIFIHRSDQRFAKQWIRTSHDCDLLFLIVVNLKITSFYKCGQEVLLTIDTISKASSNDKFQTWKYHQMNHPRLYVGTHRKYHDLQSNFLPLFNPNLFGYNSKYTFCHCVWNISCFVLL